MHKLLKRQLRRLGLDDLGNLPSDLEQWESLIENVSQGYEDLDAHRVMVERTLKLASKELTDRNKELREHVRHLQENQEIINFQAHHDALTQLPNKLLFLNHLNRALSAAERSQNLVGVLVVDIDHFKKINDTCGHEKGDLLLCNIAERIALCLRKHDTLARFGGDEFVVLLEDLSGFEIASNVAQRILNSFKEPCCVDEQKFYISVSVGISLYPRDAKDSQELIRKADMVMYHAKDTGRNNFQFYNKDFEKLALAQIEMESRLREAIVRNEFFLVYQPKVSIPGFKIAGFEALLRWQQSEGELISPALFIPVAEKSGLITQIGDWVLEESFRQISLWCEKGLANFTVSVNVSTRQLLETRWPDKLRSLLSIYEIPPEMLEIEITETALMENLEAAQKSLNEIRAMGLSISMDDFGTGYSSLSYLQNLPIDYLKIDRAFIKELGNEKESAAIALSIITLGHNLGLKVVAEGVEDNAAVEILADHECDLIQGFYFYKPLSVDDAEAALIASLKL